MPYHKIWQDRLNKQKVKSKKSRPKSKSILQEKTPKKKWVHPKSKKGWRVWRILYYGLITLILLIGIAFALLSWEWIFKDLPSPHRLLDTDFPVSTEIFDRNGKMLYEIYADQNRTPVKIDDLPDYVIQATIAIEDKDFYKHQGFAIRGIARAIYKDVFKGQLQGGSTITQQLIKNTLLTPEQTIKRKLKELALAWFTELIYSKDEILEMYLNHVPYGGTAYGIEQASKLYFDKSAKVLSLSEAALLAGLPQAPSRYSPFGSQPELAKNRQIQVLKRMVEDGYLTEEDKK